MKQMKNDKRKMKNATGGYNVAWLIPTQAVAFNVLAPIYFLTNGAVFGIAVVVYIAGLAAVVLPRERKAAPLRNREIIHQISELSAEINRLDPEFKDIALHDEYNARMAKLSRELSELGDENEFLQALTDVKSRVVELISKLHRESSQKSVIFKNQVI